MNNFVIMMEIILFFLNKFLGVNVGSCKYIIGDKELSYLNMIDKGKVTCTIVSGLGQNDVMLMYEYDIYGLCSMVKAEDKAIPVDRIYAHNKGEVIKVLSQKFNPGNMEIGYELLKNNKFYITISSCEYGDKEYTISTTERNIINKIVDNSSGYMIEVTTDEKGYPDMFIVNRSEIFEVVDDPIRYIGSYQPRYVRVTDEEVICEVGLLCNKKGNDNNG